MRKSQAVVEDTGPWPCSCGGLLEPGAVRGTTCATCKAVERLRTCRACGHDLITQHDPEDETCDAFSGDLEVGVCRCGRDYTMDGTGRKVPPLEHLRVVMADIRTLQGLSRVLSDLDRCEHGRHEGDVCGGATGCNGPSHGNQFVTDRRLGTTMSRQPIRIPERGKGHQAEDWIE